MILFIYALFIIFALIIGLFRICFYLSPLGLLMMFLFRPRRRIRRFYY
jgi:hypothetical protein